jgi:HEAT repeat protein
VTAWRHPASAVVRAWGAAYVRDLDAALIESVAHASVNPAIVFACQYARLVWLLLHDPRNVEEQKDALRAAMAVVGQGQVTIARRGSRVFANGKALPDTLAAGPELGAQMMAHGVMVVEIAPESPPADLLGTARILSTQGVRGDKGRRAKEQLDALKAAVKFAYEDASLGPRLDDKLAEPTPLPGRSMLRPALGVATPHRGMALVENREMWHQFRAVQVTGDDPTALFTELDAAQQPNEESQVLDELATLAEHASRDGRTHLLAAVCIGLVKRESNGGSEGRRQACAMMLRRLLRPALLRGLAQLLPRKRDIATDLEAVLARAGAEGADAVIELLTDEGSASDRHVYLDILPRLQTGVPTLVHMLGDTRWFVVRNAADLLGEMRVQSAESALLPLLEHADERVRKSAANALINLGTTAGFRAVCEMLQAESPKTRVHAAMALSSRRDERSTAQLRTVLEDEPDTEVQLALLGALGKIATPAAVEQLIRAAEPKRRLLERKPNAFRIAAIQALAEAKTPAAVAAIAVLREDKEREVREAAARAYQHASRTN